MASARGCSSSRRTHESGRRRRGTRRAPEPRRVIWRTEANATVPINLGFGEAGCNRLQPSSVLCQPSPFFRSVPEQRRPAGEVPLLEQLPSLPFDVHEPDERLDGGRRRSPAAREFVVVCFPHGGLKTRLTRPAEETTGAQEEGGSP